MRFTMPCVETKRLYLRPLEEEDACDMYAYLSDTRSTQFLSFPAHKDVDVTLERMKKELLPYVQLSDFEVLAITLKESDKMIGHCYLHSCHEDRAQIAYILHPSYWHQGYAIEAVLALVHIGFMECGLHRIEAIYEYSHKASEHVVHSCGFHNEGILRQYCKLSDGAYHDMVISSILRQEYKGDRIYEKRTESEI